MATGRSARSRVQINSLLTAGGVPPAMMASMSPEQRAQLLKRMKGTMPGNGSQPSAGALNTSTIFA